MIEKKSGRFIPIVLKGAALALVALIILFLCSCSLIQNGGLKFRLNDNATYYTVVGVSGQVDKNVIIPEVYKGLPVVAVAERAFDGCRDIESISIPQSVETVGDYAFYGCNQLTSVSMPDVISVGESVFEGCTSITNLTISASHLSHVRGLPLKSITITCGQSTSINTSALRAHPTLSQVIIEKGITEIGEEVFKECAALEDVKLPEGLCIIGKSAFDSCTNLKSITLPATLQQIHWCAFRFCASLTDITIPGSVESIADGAFGYCSALQLVTIEEGVRSIGSYDHLALGVFNGCNISEIVIPESVYYINGGAFDYNPLKKAIFRNKTGWKLGVAYDNLLAQDLYISEDDLTDTAHAAELLLMIGGSKYKYMKCDQ